MAVQAAGMFLAEWIWGNLSDRTDRRLLMLVSILAMSVLSPLYTLRSLLPVFIALQFFNGVLFVAIGPLTRSYVTEAAPEKSIGLYASLWWLFLVLGRVIGPLLGTYIAQTWAFEYSFWATSAISLLMAVFVLVSFPSERSRHQAHKGDMVGALRRVLSRRSAKLLFLSAALIFMGRTVASSFLPSLRLAANQDVHRRCGCSFCFGFSGSIGGNAGRRMALGQIWNKAHNGSWAPCKLCLIPLVSFRRHFLPTSGCFDRCGCRIFWVSPCCWL